MKAILTAALVLGFCGLAGARDEKADPVGTWKCEYTIGDMKRTAELTIKKDGDKLVGTMSWPDQKDEKLKDVKLKDGTLTFSAVRKFMDMEIPPVDVKLTFAKRTRSRGSPPRNSGVRSMSGSQFREPNRRARRLMGAVISCGRLRGDSAPLNRPHFAYLLRYSAVVGQGLSKAAVR